MKKLMSKLILPALAMLCVSCGGAQMVNPVLPEPELHATFKRVATSVERAFCFDGSESTGQRPFKSIVWDLGDGHTVSGKSKVTHIYEEVGYYPITLTITEHDGDTDSITIVYRINKT